MKTNPIKNNNNSCTPSGGVVKPDISPQRRASAGCRRGTFFVFLLGMYLTSYNVYCANHPVNTTQNIGNKGVIEYNNISHKYYVKKTVASWYSTEACRYNRDPKCPTASGKSLYHLEKNNEMFAASYRFALGTRVKVTNLLNSKSVVVRIEDRGPNKRLNREIDLGKEAFKKIGDLKSGLIPVSVEAL